MSTKTLWIICFVLSFILIGVILYTTVSPQNKSFKLFTKSKPDLPQITTKIYIKPPVENIGATDPKIYAKSAILIDNDTFKLLYQQNPDQKVPIASTTKIMSSMVVLDDYPDKLGDIVTLSREMINIEGSTAQLHAGEKMSVLNILKGALIVSGNDAAYSLASIFGGKDAFVVKMNEKGVTLGLKNTSYKDPAGLNDEGYSSASDLAILASYALRNKTFAEIVRTPETTIASADNRYTYDLKNSNRMMRQEEQYYYPFAIGIKTGFTPLAGHCLVSSAEKDGHKIIAVILNTDENSLTASAKESRKLLDWGFSNWTW